MKQFKLLEGVVLVCICDEYMLVATREARGKVPFLLHINEPGAFYWRMFEEKTPLREILRQASERYGMTEETALTAVKLFLNKLYGKGYLTVLDGEIKNEG